MKSDFNGDGRDDLFWLYWEDSAYVSVLARPDGTFGSLGPAWTWVPPPWQVWAIGDFDGDRHHDILWRDNSNGLVMNWLGQADGTFSNNQISSAKVQSLDWVISGSGDFNGDGRDDVLWRQAGGTVSNWLATTEGGFVDNQSAISILVPNDWTIQGIGDFNGDGLDDVLWRHSSGMVTNWLGSTGGTFTNNHSNSAVVVPNDWQIQGTGDFNGDGYDDVLWRSDGGLVTNWLGTASGGFINNHANSVELLDAPGRFSIGAIGDYNGDGRDDVVWRIGDGSTFWSEGDGIVEWLSNNDGGFSINAGAYMAFGVYWMLQPHTSGYDF